METWNITESGWFLRTVSENVLTMCEGGMFARGSTLPKLSAILRNKILI